MQCNVQHVRTRPLCTLSLPFAFLESDLCQLILHVLTARLLLQTLIIDTLMPWLAPIRWVLVTAFLPKILLK